MPAVRFRRMLCDIESIRELTAVYPCEVFVFAVVHVAYAHAPIALPGSWWQFLSS